MILNLLSIFVKIRIKKYRKLALMKDIETIDLARQDAEKLVEMAEKRSRSSYSNENEQSPVKTPTPKVNTNEIKQKEPDFDIDEIDQLDLDLNDILGDIKEFDKKHLPK